MNDIKVQCDEYEWMTFTYKGALYRWIKKPNKLLRYFKTSDSWEPVSNLSEAAQALAVHVAVNEIARM